ncbi:1-acyl-sn-glycerol-3-phosphate acyltransferase [Nymphaea thermarum]|nr:1-acyl-sn-glycerol-3-phosphate acyltransferase [Nymphaea thermarum]
MQDALLDKHVINGTFVDEPFQDIGRPLKSMMVILFWVSLLSFASSKLFKWSLIFSSWTGIICTTAVVLLVALLMHIFILFSQAERSTPAKISPSRATNGGVPVKQSKQK